jgi:hypothetical protein
MRRATNAKKPRKWRGRNFWDEGGGPAERPR